MATTDTHTSTAAASAAAQPAGPASATPPKRSIRPLVVLLLVCLAPLLLALLAYYVPALGLRPAEQTNYGTLLQPQRPMPDAASLRLTTLDGQPFDLQSLRGKWLLLTADQAACPESCARKLFILRNSHASQGKNVERIKRVWFILDDAPVPDVVRDAYQGTVFVRADPAQLAAFLAHPKQTQHAASAASQTAAGGMPASAGHSAADAANAALTAPMWIIDPLGNLMLQFPADADPIKVRKDIAKLLFGSRVG